MDWTGALAAWGATVGTASLAWNIYNAGWRDRARLRVSAVFDPKGLVLTVTNSGRRQITVTGWWYSAGSARSVEAQQKIETEGLPHLLGEHQLLELRPVGVLAWRTVGAAVSSAQMFVTGSDGRRACLSPSELRALRAEYERLDQARNDLDAKIRAGR